MCAFCRIKDWIHGIGQLTYRGVAANIGNVAGDAPLLLATSNLNSLVVGASQSAQAELRITISTFVGMTRLPKMSGSGVAAHD